MAVSASGNDAPITAINVTPFVDVVLVLLVIFMATSSYIINPAIEVDLPEAASGGDTVETTLALVLSQQGQLYLDGEPASRAQIAERCRSESTANPNIQAIIAADGQSRHAQVVELIDLIKQNGVEHFALNIDPSDSPPPSR
jgi:biopolymer transport protein ExbD